MLRRSLHSALRTPPPLQHPQRWHATSVIAVAATAAPHSVTQLQQSLCSCRAHPALSSGGRVAAAASSTRAFHAQSAPLRIQAQSKSNSGGKQLEAKAQEQPQDDTEQQHSHAERQTVDNASAASANAAAADATAAAAPASSASTSASLPGTSHLYRNFTDLGVPNALVHRLDSLGITAPTLIQQRVISFLARYSHTGVLVHAPTGTGKSLAFLLPVLTRLLNQRAEAQRTGRPPLPGIQAVVMLPTQELAMQTYAQLQALLDPAAQQGDNGLNAPLGALDEHFTALCVGGFDSVEDQREALKAHPPAILVGTPRRLNSVFFPAYETHGRWQDKRRSDAALAEIAAREASNPQSTFAHARASLSRQEVPRQVIFDPPEDGSDRLQMEQQNEADVPNSTASTPLPLVSEMTNPKPKAAKNKTALLGVEGWLDPADWAEEDIRDAMEEDEDEEEDDYIPGRGESHKARSFAAGSARAIRSTRVAAMEAEFIARNNIAAVAGDSTVGATSADAQEEDDEDFDDSLDGVDEMFLPPRHAVGFEAQKLLRMQTRIARTRIVSPLKRLISTLQFLVVDEADDVLQPLSKFCGKKVREKRQLHPKPAQVFVRGLSLLNPTMQLIAASATINAPFRLLLSRLGFWRPKPVQISIASRATGMQAAAEAAFAKEQEEKKAAALAAAKQAGQLPASSGSPPLSDPGSTSTALTTPNFSDMATWRSHVRSLGIPWASAMQYNHSCPPNLKHFWVLVPDWSIWRARSQHLPFDYPRRIAFDALASQEKRQAMHEFNMEVTRSLRRKAHLVDKLASIGALITHFQPRCALLVVPEPEVDGAVVAAVAGNSAHTNVAKRRSIGPSTVLQGDKSFNLHTLCEQLAALDGIRPTVLFHHLSNPDLKTRAKFFREIQEQQQSLDGGEESKYNLLLVSLASLRGLDLPSVDLVLLLSPPRDASSYVHAAGRTGRLGREGSVITLAHPEELVNMDQLTHYMPETLGGSKQIMLPAMISPKLQRNILQLYEKSKPARRAAIAEMDKQINAKLKKTVMSDERRDERGGRTRMRNNDESMSELEQFEREQGRLPR